MSYTRTLNLSHAGGPVEVTVGKVGLTVLAELCEHGEAVNTQALAYRLGRAANESFRTTVKRLLDQGLIARYTTDDDPEWAYPSRLNVTEVGLACLVCCECRNRARFLQGSAPACHVHADRVPLMPDGPFDPRRELVPRSRRNRSAYPVVTEGQEAS